MWSVILRTRDPKDPNRIAALIQVCSQYSMALYAYARRKGSLGPECRDAVRRFLAHVRAGRLDDGPGEARNRLRAYLVRGFEYFLAQPAPRPGPSVGDDERSPLAPAFSEAESWLQTDLAKTDSPETTFHRAWARCVLSQSYAVLKRELAARHGDRAAEVISAEISPLGRPPFNAELAPRLGLSPSEVLEALRSSRRRLREIILATLRETVPSSSDVEIEFWDLFKSI